MSKQGIVLANRFSKECRTPPTRGKVRDIYDLGDKLLLVVTDRISAYDVIMNEGIPDKGKVLK